MVSYSVILFVSPQHGQLLGYFVCRSSTWSVTRLFCLSLLNMVRYSVILFVAPQHGPLLGYFVCKLLIDVIMPPVVMSLQEDESIEIQTKRIEMNRSLYFCF